MTRTLLRRPRPAAVLRHRTGGEQRPTFFELFYDLVFVFAVTQLSHLLLTNLSLRGALETAFLLLVVWWAWIYTTWMTSWFNPETVAPARVVLLVGMLSSLLMAIAIPDAFGDRAFVFAGAYVALQFVRNTFIVVATDESEPLHRPFRRLWFWNTAIGAIWIAGALLPERELVVVWTIALVLDYAGPLAGYWTPRLGRGSPADWEVEHAHFAERFQLFVIVALGESIVLTGATAAHQELTLARALAITVAFLVTAALWWLYFDRVAARSRHDFEIAGAARGRLARDAFTYMHIPIVAGIIVAAVVDELVIAHPGDQMPREELIALASGPILYLLGHAGFQLLMTRRTAHRRLYASAAIVVVALAGTALSALATWTLVLAVLVALVAAEYRGRPPRTISP